MFIDDMKLLTGAGLLATLAGALVQSTRHQKEMELQDAHVRQLVNDTLADLLKNQQSATNTGNGG